VLAHLGETLPFCSTGWTTAIVADQCVRHRSIKRLPSEYFRDNFLITTSGMNYSAPLKAALAAMGPDKVLFAADHRWKCRRMPSMNWRPSTSRRVKAKIFEPTAASIQNELTPAAPGAVLHSARTDNCPARSSSRTLEDLLPPF